MKSLSNRLLVLLAVGLLPILSLQIFYLTQTNGVGATLVFVVDAVSLALSVLVCRRLICRPVIQLLGAAENWRTGHFAGPVGLREDASEFGRLAGAFKALMAAVESREQALHNALESTTDVVFVMDRDWRYTYRNGRAKDVFSDGRDLLGEVIWEVFPDRVQSIFGKAYRDAMETGVPTHVSGYFAPMDSWWEAHAYPSKDGLAVFCRDVTEEYQAAAALRDSEERLRLALDAARMGVREFNLVTGEATWTPEAAEILGRDYRADASLDGWFAAIHPDDQPIVQASLDRAFSSADNNYHAEYRLSQSDGTWRWIAGYGRVVFEAGSAVRAISVVQDISARKRVEEVLRESQTRLQLAHQAAGFGLWDWDFEAGTQIWSDDQWRLYGLEPQPVALSVDAWAHCIHPEDRERVLADRAGQFGGTSDRIHNQFRITWPGGAVRWLVVRGAIIRDARGKLTRAVGVTLDVTARCQTEADLRRLGAELEARLREEVSARENAQMRAVHAERMQALGQLAGGIAHDVNNVLQTVSGVITLIARRTNDPPAIRRLTKLADEATERGSSITRRLLAFGRPGDLRSEAIDAAKLLYGLREILVHTIEPGIDIQVRLEHDLRPFRADKSQLEIALINLATNARDAMPKGGKLTLSAANEVVFPGAVAHPGQLGSGRYTRICIEDTGLGMDAATLARATEPFFTTKAIGAGTGLGLAMSKGLAEQSGGGMSVTSSPNQGTTVTLWLPEAISDAVQSIEGRPQTPAKTMAAAVGNATDAVRVMLVDDDTLLRRILAMNLEDAGYCVLPAASGREALALLAAGEVVEAVVTDLSMPGMDGLSLIRAMRERHPALPAVLLTGYAGDEAAPAVHEANSGTFLLVRKPASTAQIVDCLNILLTAR